jgi:hypothetical protein
MKDCSIPHVASREVDSTLITRRCDNEERMNIWRTWWNSYGGLGMFTVETNDESSSKFSLGLKYYDMLLLTSMEWAS